MTGVFTGGAGAVGEAVATQGVKTIVVRGATGCVTGVASKALNEVKECTVNGKEWSNFGKEIDENGNDKGTVSAWLLSAGTGSLGGNL